MRAPGRPWVALLGWCLLLIASAPACTGDEQSRDTGTAPFDKGLDMAPDNSAPDAALPEASYCVRYFDGTCENMGFKCKSLPSSCFPGVCLNCPDLACGKSGDGSNPPFIWGCGYSCGKDSQPPLPYDIPCKGP